MTRHKSYTLSKSVCKQLALPPVPYIHHLGRAVVPHAVLDDQHKARSLIVLGLPVLNTGLHLFMNGQGVWNYTHMSQLQNSSIVIPAEAGIQFYQVLLDPGSRPG